MVNIIIVNITTRHFQLVLVQSLSGAPLVSPSDPLGTVTPPQYRTLLVLIWHKRCYSYAHMAHLLGKGKTKGIKTEKGIFNLTSK